MNVESFVIEINVIEIYRYFVRSIIFVFGVCVFTSGGGYVFIGFFLSSRGKTYGVG